MTTLERMTTDLTTSMKARDTFRTGTLRQIIGAVRTAEKSGSVARELSDEQVQSVLVSEVKKRRESAGIYSSLGMAERAATEDAEADFIETYLPAAASDAQLDEAVTAAIEQVGATSVKDMGKVMKAATGNASQFGRVDGKALSAKVRAALSA